MIIMRRAWFYWAGDDGNSVGLSSAPGLKTAMSETQVKRPGWNGHPGSGEGIGHERLAGQDVIELLGRL